MTTSAGTRSEKPGDLAAQAMRVLREEGFSGVLSRLAGRLSVFANPIAARYQAAAGRRFAETARHYNDGFFAEANTSRAEAEALYVAISDRCELLHRPNESVQRLAFAALAAGGLKPDNVLEIGTEHGETTQFLAEIFPEARVFTINLPDDDPAYRAWHPEGSDAHEHNLARRLSASNIVQVRANTAWLMTQDIPEAFDLIWLDGGHRYPEIAWDHFFCMQRLAPGGWLFSDDITLPDQDRLLKRVNLHPFEVIDYYNARCPDTFKLLLKREDGLSYVRGRKFIAYHRNTA